MFSRALLRQVVTAVSSKSAATNVARVYYAPAFAATTTTTSRRLVYTMSEELDPNKIFDKVDTNQDNMINRDEFLHALESIQYDELLKLHEIAKNNLANLSKKLHTVKLIEKHLQDLENVYEEKQNIYNNVGWETSADIDALFQKSKTSKNDMKDALSELKDLIEEAKTIFTTNTASAASTGASSTGTREEEAA